VSGDFWAAVEREDLASIVGTLGVPEEPLSAVLPALASWRRGRIEQSTLDGWRYRVGWKTVTAERGQTLHGTWLLLVPEGLDHPWIGAAADALRTAGATIVPVEVGDTDRAGLAALLSGAVGRKPAAGNAGAGNAAAGKTAGELRGVLSLLALEESPHPEYPVLPLGLAKTLLTVQALGDAGISVPLWLATAGAVAAGRADAVTSPKQAQTWGLGRVVGLEHADRWGGIVDLPPVPGKAAAQWFAAAMAGCGDEDQLAVRDSGLLARRLVRAPSRPGGPARDWRPAGTVLITGGTGGLGACVARWLAAKGATRLVLASRSGPQAAGVPALIAELGELGAVATAVRLDVADRASVRGLLAGLDEETPVSSVVHAAGLVQATTVADTSLAEVADVLAAKVAGAVNLDELLDRELDAFVLFSSNAGVWGSGGQGAYAAGNAFLDALAQQRRERGLAATSVAWGAWRGSGMAARDDAEQQLKRRGIRAMAPELTLAALSRALDDDETFLAVADVDWPQFAKGFTAARSRPLLAELPEARQAQADDAAVPADDSVQLARTLAALPPAEQERAVLQHLRGAVAAVLGHASADAVDGGRPFKDIGFDSLTALELRNRLKATTGLRLPSTLVFDHPTPAALARFLRGELTEGAPDPSAAALAELEKLDAAISGISQNDDAFSVITSRLQSMLTKLSPITTSRNDAGLAQQLETATDDEIFDYIHRELGR
jgi:NAD(P)-dependent dehydrogenase (short-subunit alcohol dehydrogenase family)